MIITALSIIAFVVWLVGPIIYGLSKREDWS